MEGSESEDVTFDLASDVTAPALARRFVDEHSDHLPADMVADAALLVTELVTNAVQHGRPGITLRICVDPPRLGVLVGDEGVELPSVNPTEPSLDRTGGRGLLIVDRVSSDWGVIPAGTTAGKTVWFELTATQYESIP